MIPNTIPAPTATDSASSIDKFLEHCHRRRYPAKSVIIYAGDQSDVLYYIVEGSVTVLIEDDDGHAPVLQAMSEIAGRLAGGCR